MTSLASGVPPSQPRPSPESWRWSTRRQAPARATPTYALYELFNQQAGISPSCAATGSGASSCFFHDLTFGSNSQPCYHGSPNCVSTGTDTYGTLSGGQAGAGYDTASGLGSVNALNLVNGWANAKVLATSTALALSPVSITHGSPVSVAVAVTASTGTPSGSVSVTGLVANGAVVSGTLNSSGDFNTKVLNFPGGTYSVTAYYAGSASCAERLPGGYAGGESRAQYRDRLAASL